MKQISFVVPCYNSEAYMEHCIDSLLIGGDDIEIIIIDDGSKEEFKTDYSWATVIRQNNAGASAARNTGLDNAKGEYISFIDADDLYVNPQILEMSYQACIKHDLDILEFDYFGGRFDIKTLEFKDAFLFSNQNKNLYDKLFTQPDIKKKFFYQAGTEDILAGIVYNKVYSHREIEKMADYIGKEFWTQHFIYMEDFIMVFAVARTAERMMLLGYAGVFHWYENPDGMTDGVFEMDGNKLKYPDNTNKKLGDYLSMWEKAIDLTENEKDSEY
jgi:glycosyltransferase involved in cell wall biosynthesis